MHLIWKRYTRSGYAPPWFYWLIGAGFLALTVWALSQRDWLVAAIAAVMIPVTIAGSVLMRRLREASAASQRAIDARKDGTQ
jgi:D-serine deaminase-like pyridoxal phosphate-dependent protein